MITKDNLKEVLEILNFNSKDKIVYEKFYQNSDKISIKVDFDKKLLITCLLIIDLKAIFYQALIIQA